MFFWRWQKTKTGCARYEMPFWRVQKDKLTSNQARTVFLNLSKGENRLHPGSNCLFEVVKRTKRTVTEPGMSFWNRQKDKTGCTRARTVFLKPLKGQKEWRLGPNCLFKLVKRTKQAASGLKLSFWSRQKDKRSGVGTRTVFLSLSKGQNKLHPGSNCLFEAVKRTKGVALGPELSF